VKSSNGKIIGSAVGGSIGGMMLAALILACAFAWRRRQKKKVDMIETSSVNPYPGSFDLLAGHADTTTSQSNTAPDAEFNPYVYTGTSTSHTGGSGPTTVPSQPSYTEKRDSKRDSKSSRRMSKQEVPSWQYDLAPPYQRRDDDVVRLHL